MAHFILCKSERCVIMQESMALVGSMNELSIERLIPSKLCKILILKNLQNEY